MFNKNEEFVKIGAIAGRSGLSVSTRRYYTELGLHCETYRTPGDICIYDRSETLKRIDEIVSISNDKTLKEVAAAV